MTLMKLASKTRFLLIVSMLFFSILVIQVVPTSHAYTECDGIQDGDQVKLDYIGKTSDGNIFDSTQNKGPATFTISKGQLIEGFYQGMLKLKIGDSKTITVPPSLGYTDPNNDLFGKTLIFDVHILDVLNQWGTCNTKQVSKFGNFLWKAFLVIGGGGAAVVLGIGAYMGLQNRVLTPACTHCKENGRDRKSEGVCGKCGQPSCRASFARGCPNCGSNTFIPHNARNNTSV